MPSANVNYLIKQIATNTFEDNSSDTDFSTSSSSSSSSDSSSSSNSSVERKRRRRQTVTKQLRNFNKLRKKENGKTKRFRDIIINMMKEAREKQEERAKTKEKLLIEGNNLLRQILEQLKKNYNK